MERRRFPRLACHAQARYRDVLAPGAVQTGAVVKDVSADGVKLQATHFLARHHRILVQVILPGLLAPIRMIAEVVWSARQPRGESYDVGARFLEITPEDRGRVATYVERGVVQPR